MNRTTLTLALTLGMLLLLVACASPEVDKRLADIEQQMHSQPDSALAHIQELSLHHRITHPRQRAWHALLHAQALDKNFIDSTNDSIINIAVEYYENSNDLYHKMLSFYYLGRIKYNAKEYEPCIIALLNAEMCALEIEDFFYQGLIYRSFAHVYNTIYYGNGEMEYAQKSYEAFSKTNFQQHTDFALLELAQTYYNNKKFDVCELIINELVNSVSISDDAHFHYLTYILKADLFLATGLYNEALIIYEDLINIDSDKFTAIDYIHLSMCHQQCNDIVNAQKYAQKAATLDSMETWGLYLLCNSWDDKESALLYLKKEFDLQNELLSDISSQTVFATVEKYHKTQNIIQKQKNERNLLLFSTIFFVAIIVITIITVYHNKLNKAEIERNVAMAQSLKNMLLVKNSQICELHNNIKEIFSTQFAALDELCSVFYEYKSEDKRRLEIYNSIMSIILNMGNDKSTITEIENIINKYMDNLMIHFHNDFNNLSEDDIKLYIYLVMKISPRAIAVLQNIKIETVYNRKSSLKRKILSHHDVDSEKYLFAFS